MLRLPPQDCVRDAHPEGLKVFQDPPNWKVWLCHLDGIPMDQHARCTWCGILMGPHHVEPVSQDGLCSSCRSWQRRS